MIYKMIVVMIMSFGFMGFSQEAKSVINKNIDQWHQAATDADLKAYTSLMTEDAVFIGTDPTEYWQGQDFINFAKPYFDKGKAWSFSTLERHIYINKNMAWFDELLNTQMGICRGSGVLIKVNSQWRIKHYVLSIAIPNEEVDEVKALKAEFDQNLIEKY